jgi:hypothetical protein
MSTNESAPRKGLVEKILTRALLPPSMGLVSVLSKVMILWVVKVVYGETTTAHVLSFYIIRPGLDDTGVF